MSDITTDEDRPTIDSVNIQRQLWTMRVGLVGIALGWIGSTVWLIAGTTRVPAVLAVERLEIVEPDGSPALVLANSQRPTAGTMNGQVVLEDQEQERLGMPSIIFFDGRGDEVGGMMFGVREVEGGYSAVRQLSFDGYKQDQTVVLSHDQDPEGSISGLTVIDRPDHSLVDALAQLGLQPGTPRSQLAAALEAIPAESRDARFRELFGTRRAFFGSGREGEASLVLMDGEGRHRVIIETPREGEPSISILDEDGGTVLRLPGS